MGERHRSPRLVRPRRRAILVEAPVSSMKTRCSGSRSGWASNQACRRAATSGRSCSLACAVFFQGDAMAVKKAPDRTRGKHGAMLPPQEIRELNQRDVHLLVDRTQDDVAVSLDAMGTPVSALALR